MARHPKSSTGASHPPPVSRRIVQPSDDAAICSSYLLFPNSREIRCHFLCGVTKAFCHSRVHVCLVTYSPFVNVIEEVGPWITFHGRVWPDWSTTLHAQWPKYGLHSGELQAPLVAGSRHQSPCREKKQSISDAPRLRSHKFWCVLPGNQTFSCILRTMWMCFNSKPVIGADSVDKCSWECGSCSTIPTVPEASQSAGWWHN